MGRRGGSGGLYGTEVRLSPVPIPEVDEVSLATGLGGGEGGLDSFVLALSIRSDCRVGRGEEVGGGGGEGGGGGRRVLLFIRSERRGGCFSSPACLLGRDRSAGESRTKIFGPIVAAIMVGMVRLTVIL